MEDISSDLIANIESYQQLLTTLSLGVAAGAFAFLSQIIFHNSQNSSAINLRAVWLVFLAIFAHLTAILFGVFTKSALVSSIPALHKIQWGSESATEYLTQAGLGHISFWSMMQVLAFGAGALLLFVVLVLNWSLVRR